MQTVAYGPKTYPDLKKLLTIKAREVQTKLELWGPNDYYKY